MSSIKAAEGNLGRFFLLYRSSKSVINSIIKS